MFKTMMYTRRFLKRQHDSLTAVEPTNTDNDAGLLVYLHGSVVVGEDSIGPKMAKKVIVGWKLGDGRYSGCI